MDGPSSWKMYEEKYNICRQCQHMGDYNMCEVTGRNMRIRLLFEEVDCPKHKWVIEDEPK